MQSLRAVLSWDEALLLAVRRRERRHMTGMMRGLSRAGSGLGWTLIALLVMVLAGRHVGWLIGCGAALGTLVTQLPKRLCRRARPTCGIAGFVALAENPDAFSFPSGHAAAAFAVAAALARAGHPLAPASFVFATTIGFSRVYLGAHYPLDVAVGALLGVAAGALVPGLVAVLPAPAIAAHAAALALVCAAAVGIALLGLQIVTLVRHAREARRHARGPAISILKPLCGQDDALFENLASFAALDYPDYEVLLGVRNLDDSALPSARAAVTRWPDRFRLVVQESAPGLNPKVNQLLTLARKARHNLLVISDSNVRVSADYLAEIAGELADPQVGLVTHPVSGIGEQRLGALCDALHLVAGVGMSMVAAHRLAGRGIVVGKSMAFRRTDLAAAGGLASVKDMLAEDFLLGRQVERSGKRVIVARAPVFQVAANKSIAEFIDRYVRWSVMQRKAAGGLAYAGLLLLNPVFLTGAALLVEPGPPTGLALLAAIATRLLVDGVAGRTLRPGGFSSAALLAAPLKDLLIASAWLAGLVRSTVTWRGTRLLVGDDTRLSAPAQDEIRTHHAAPSHSCRAAGGRCRAAQAIVVLPETTVVPPEATVVPP